jgi:glycosyltransferase 2 family protein
MTFSKVLKMAIKLAISAALVWWILSKADEDVLVQYLGKISVSIIVLLLIAMSLLAIVQAVRWSTILSHLGTTLAPRNAISITFLSMFFNQTLPSTIGGDIVRAWAAHRSGAGLGVATNSVIIDRLMALLTLLLFGTATVPYLLTISADNTAVLAIIGIIASGIAGTVFLALLHKLPRTLKRWLIFRGLMDLSRTMVLVMCSPRILLHTLGHSLVIHLGIVVVAFFIGRTLDPGANFLDYLAIIPTVILVSSLPISIAGWGVREGAMVVGMGLVGIPANLALAVSLLLGGLFVLAGLVGAGFWFMERKLPGASAQAPANGQKLERFP